MHLQNPQPTLIPDFWGNKRIGALTAPILDRIADAELQHGHVARAEQLSQLAAQLRGAA